METRLILITGGARSGKSRFAQTLAEHLEGHKVFIATAQPLDEEMSTRIEKHKRERPAGWDTIEESARLAQAVKKCSGNYQVVLIDCLTMWISHLLTQRTLSESEIVNEVQSLITSCKTVQGTVVIVSNEVGWGIVPANKVSRIFRDIVGRANQDIASHADKVYLVVSGIPLKLKG